MEALGGVLEVLESVLEALGGDWEALGSVLEVMLSQDSAKKVQERENIEKTQQKTCFLATRGGGWLGRVFLEKRLGCVAGALISQDKG